MRRFMLRRFDRSLWAMLLLLVAVVSASCSSGEDNSPPAQATTQTSNTAISDAEVTSLAADLRSSFAAGNVTAVSRALSHAGIAVYSNDMSQQQVGAPAKLAAAAVYPSTRMLSAQARGMAMELSQGGGFTGALLDTLTVPLPLQDGTLVPVSRLLAAYIAHGDTYGARQSRALLPGLDPARHLETRFPTLTIVFFMKEFVVPLLAATQDPAAFKKADVIAAKVLSATAVSDPCGAVSEFLDDLPSSVENAVQDLLDPGRSSGLLSLVARVVGGIVEITTEGVKNLIRHTPFANALREVANTLGTLTDMQSLFSQWQVEIAPPASLHKVPGSPNSGDFVLTMDNGGDGFEWPEAVTSCADLFGISLPQLDSADGSRVTWHQVSGFNDLGLETARTEVIAGNRASYSVTSANEGADVHNAGGPVEHGALAVRADVQMPGIEQIAGRIGSLLGSLGERAASVASSVAPHIGPSAPGETQVEYHESTPATADTNGAIKLHAYSCGGVSGVWTGTFSEQHPFLGQVSATKDFQFGADNTAEVSYTRSYGVDCAKVAETRTWYLVLSGMPDSPVIDGEIKAAESSFTYAVDGSGCPEPGGGTITTRDQHLGIAPIVRGPTPECQGQ